MKPGIEMRVGSGDGILEDGNGVAIIEVFPETAFVKKK